MADFIMEDIEIEEDQEYVITDPDLYVNRFNKAIEEQRFDDALFEAEKAIEYSNDAKEYQIFKLQALFASGRYQDCVDYIGRTGLWYNRGELEKDIADILYKINSECLQYLFINLVKNERRLQDGKYNIAELPHNALSQWEKNQIDEYIKSFASEISNRFDTNTANRICKDYRDYLEIETRSGRSIKNIIEDIGLPQTVATELSQFRDNGTATIVNITNNNYVIVSQRAFLKALKQTNFSIYHKITNVANLAISGELFEISDGYISITSIDGHRVSSRTIPTKSGNISLKAIIPGSTIEKIISTVNDNIDGDMRIYLNDESILFICSGVMIASNLIPGEFPATSFEYTSRIMINRGEFEAVLEKAVLLNYGTDSKKALVLEISDNNMTALMNTPNGKINEVIKIRNGGSDIRIGFNPQFLLDVMKNIDDELIYISFNNDIDPCLISDSKSYSYIVLPMNIRGEEYGTKSNTNNEANNNPKPANADGENASVSKVNSSDKNDGLNELELLANYGDTDALFKMGILYSTGNGVKQDEERALEYFKEAADAGHTGARIILNNYEKANNGNKPYVTTSNSSQTKTNEGAASTKDTYKKNQPEPNPSTTHKNTSESDINGDPICNALEEVAYKVGKYGAAIVCNMLGNRTANASAANQGAKAARQQIEDIKNNKQ